MTSKSWKEALLRFDALKFNGLLQHETFTTQDLENKAQTRALLNVEETEVLNEELNTFVVGASIDVGNSRVLAGFKALAGNSPPKSSIVVEKLAKTGALYFGHSTMSPLGFGWVGQAAHGSVINVSTPS